MENREVLFHSADLSGIQSLLSVMGNGSEGVEFSESLELQEGQGGAVIDLEVTGNVPHYAVSCEK